MIASKEKQIRNGIRGDGGSVTRTCSYHPFVSNPSIPSLFDPYQINVTAIQLRAGSPVYIQLRKLTSPELFSLW